MNQKKSKRLRRALRAEKKRDIELGYAKAADGSWRAVGFRRRYQLAKKRLKETGLMPGEA